MSAALLLSWGSPVARGTIVHDLPVLWHPQFANYLWCTDVILFAMVICPDLLDFLPHVPGGSF
jgi:hypothetical protein